MCEKAPNAAPMPDLLFLDEPTSGLDPEAQRDFRELLGELSRERQITVFLNTHKLDEAQRVCTKVAIIDEGSLQVCDSLENLRQNADPGALEIVLATKADAHRALALLNSDPRVRECSASDLTVSCVLAGNQRVSVSDLARKDIEIEEFRRVAKSLEDVYLEVVRRAEGSS